jgi:hypothetical protein
MVFSRTRGTIASPAALSTNDQIFQFVFNGGTSTGTVPTAGIRVDLDGSTSAGIAPGKIILQTANTSGTFTDQFSVNSQGTATFTGMAQLATFANETAANAAVGGTPVNGMMYYDTGANMAKIYGNGAWRAIW